jgi:GNAT superfamily N-acetyltransferase
MSIPSISSASEQDRQRLVSTIITGFSTDPLLRWLWPEAIDYLKCAPFFNAFCGATIDLGCAYKTEHCEGAAMWFPPGSAPNEETLVQVMANSIRADIQEDSLRILEAMGEYHPTEPCWYLAVIGVDAAHQGSGFGAALMKHALLRCDAEGLPAYLESSNPRNMSLYQRHGFEGMGAIQFGSSPTIVPMLRLPKAQG